MLQQRRYLYQQLFFHPYWRLPTRPQQHMWMRFRGGSARISAEEVDHLRGLKENVTMGRLIPAGTGFEYYRHVRIPVDEPPPPPPPTPEELELEREMEYFVEPEAFTRDEIE
jgi:hypothetical protein